MRREIGEHRGELGLRRLAFVGAQQRAPTDPCGRRAERGTLAAPE
ncbi:hypothetical protein ABIC16_001112 [Sphingomonas sp. PvP055]